MPLGSRILTLPAFLVCSVYTFQLVGKVEFSLLFFSFLSFSVQEAATLFGLSSEFTITAVWLLAGNGPQLMMSRDEMSCYWSLMAVIVMAAIVSGSQITQGPGKDNTTLFSSINGHRVFVVIM